MHLFWLKARIEEDGMGGMGWDGMGGMGWDGMGWEKRVVNGKTGC